MSDDAAMLAKQLYDRLRRAARNLRYTAIVVSRILFRHDVERCCPCCGCRGRFDSEGQPPRYNVRCPQCGSLDRHRLLALTDQQEDLFSGKEVLHFAPESAISRLIAPRAKRYLTADIDAARADIVLDIERIEQPAESWDLIVCSHVLEHVNDQAALAELFRVLRRGGQLVAMVPVVEGWATSYEDPAIVTEREREAHFGLNDHVRYYGQDIRERFKKAGFDTREVTAFGADVVKYGLMRGEKVFLCTKPR